MTDSKHICAQELHTVNLRVTPARLGVLEILEKSDTPVDVSTVVSSLKNRDVQADEATVFRILRTFCDKGIIRPIQFYENKMRYEYADKPKHHHFVCEKCGDITDIAGCPVTQAEKQIEKTIGGKIMRHSLEFFGLCKRCL